VKTRVKIYCKTDEICSLIKKVLNKHNIDTKCENYAELLSGKQINEIISECKNSADIVVLDQELDKDFKLKMVQNLNQTTFICLPSLKNNDLPEVPANVYQISEPFKLSEFEEVLMNLIKNNKSV
jgi:hypothetical protein